MKLNDIVASMSGYLSEQTIVDFIMYSKSFDDTRYSVLKTKAIDKVSIALLAAAKTASFSMTSSSGERTPASPPRPLSRAGRIFW